MKQLTDQEYKLFFSKVPRICVDVIVKSGNGIILGKRQIPPHRNLYHLPGGRVLFKEPIESACMRIVKAEIGIEIKVEKQLGYIELLNEETGTHTISLVFLAQALTSDFTESTELKAIRIFNTLPKSVCPDQSKLLTSLKRSKVI